MIVESFHGRLQFTIYQITPREVSEPRVIFYLIYTCPTQPFNWFPLQKFIGEISGLDTPTFWYLSLRDDDLFFLYFLFYLLP
jgi:hypothetical protein